MSTEMCVISLKSICYIRKYRRYKCALSTLPGDPMWLSELPWTAYVERMEQDMAAFEEAAWYEELNRGYAQDRI